MHGPSPPPTSALHRAVLGMVSARHGPRRQEGRAGRGPARRFLVDPGLRYCLVLFVGIRVALALIALMGVALLPDFSHVPDSIRTQIPLVPTPVSVPGWPAHAVTAGWHNLFTSWERLDALWFLRIAAGGYRTTDASAAFFPLYPLAIRGISGLLGSHPFAASLLISNVATLGSMMVLYRLTAFEFDEDMARRAVTYLAVFPAALFLFAPYSESLFLLLALLSLFAARRGRWEAAGVAGALAALTRNVGIALVIPLAVEAVHQGLTSRPPRVQGRGLWALAPALGGFLYLWYWRLKSGDWLAPLHAQKNWDRHLTDPISTVGKGANLAFRYVGGYPGGYHMLDFVLAAVVLAAAAYAALRFRPIYATYAVVSIVVPLASIFEGRPLIAFSRYAVPIFPVYWAMGRWTAGHRAWHEVVVGASAMLLGLMTLLFVNWYYVI